MSDEQKELNFGGKTLNDIYREGAVPGKKDREEGKLDEPSEVPEEARLQGADISNDGDPEVLKGPGVHEEDLSTDHDREVPKSSSIRGGDNGPDGGKGGKKGNRLKWVFIALLGVMVLVIGWLVYVLMTERSESEEMRITLEIQKENLTNELNELYASYDSLETDNDSMNSMIEERQQEIRSLLAIRESNAKKIRIYDERVKSLQKVLRDYVVQVDSLNQANLRLQAENRAVNEKIREATTVNRQLEQQNQTLQDKVQSGSVVSAFGIIAEPIMDNGDLARRTKRVEKIRTCFNLSANPLGKKGPRTIYIRIFNPAGRIMIKNTGNLFNYEGNEIAFSEFREIEYEGEEINVCIYYEVDPADITEGTYYVDLYMDGESIGTSSFSLR